MSKRLHFSALAVGLLASLAFVTPVHASPTQVTQNVSFGSLANTTSLTEIDFTYTGAGTISSVSSFSGFAFEKSGSNYNPVSPTVVFVSPKLIEAQVWYGGHPRQRLFHLRFFDFLRQRAGNDHGECGHETRWACGARDRSLAVILRRSRTELHGSARHRHDQLPGLPPFLQAHPACLIRTVPLARTHLLGNKEFAATELVQRDLGQLASR